MFILSKKGSLLLLIGIGLLLTFVPPSSALSCYMCFGEECYDPKPLEETDCSDGVILCKDGTSVDDRHQAAPDRACGERSDNKEGCKDDTDWPGYKICFCATNLCNDGNGTGWDKMKYKHSGNNGNGSPSSPKASLSVLEAVASPVLVNGALLIIGYYCWRGLRMDCNHHRGKL